MRRYYLKLDDRNKFDSFPMRIAIDGLSTCCNKTRILVQSKEGGFITANCIGCNTPKYIFIDHFKTIDKDVACPLCDKVMSTDCVPDVSLLKERNLGFKCDSCQIYIWASDLVRNWDFSDKLDTSGNNEFFNEY